MSQPKRRRRRRRKPGGGGQPAEQQQRQSQDRANKPPEQSVNQRRRRRRGRRGRTQDGQSSSPRSSEDLVRALPKERPETLSAPPDGQDLDQIIGELQSVWGVPQYPQEYRITVKIAEDRDSRGEQTAVVEETGEADEGRAPGETGAPVREKAPAAPLMRSRSQNGGGPQREKAPRRRRRRRRGRGGGGGSGGGGSNGGGQPS